MRFTSRSKLAKSSSLRPGLLILCRIASVVLACVLAVPAGSDAIKGKARVIDGDTIEIEGEEIRLAGIDAPEMGTMVPRCGGVSVSVWTEGCGILAIWNQG